MSIAIESHRKFPEWLKRHLPEKSAEPVRGLLQDLKLNTVCHEAKCPNLQECWSHKTATFMVAGRLCTRACSFCSIETQRPKELELDEPERVAEAAFRMGLSHVVVTMVARDDREDGASEHVAKTIAAIRLRMPEASIEVLTSDFQERIKSIRTVCEAAPHVFNHNIETVKRLTPEVRSRSEYDRTLRVLAWVGVNYPQIHTKSGIMLGFGEREEEVLETLSDLRKAGVQMVTIGQYLRSDIQNRPVSEFIHPDKFAFYGQEAEKIGFLEVASGPFVRSSYNARESFLRASTPRNK